MLKSIQFLMFIAMTANYWSIISLQTNDEKLIQKFDAELGQMSNKRQILFWKYLTNMSIFNARELNKFESTLREWKLNWIQWSRESYKRHHCGIFSFYGNENVLCSYLERMKKIGVIFENESIANQLNEVKTNTTLEYANISVLFNNRLVVGENDVGKLMSEIQNDQKLKSIWTQFHRNGNTKLWPLFLQMIKLLNDTAVFNCKYN